MSSQQIVVFLHVTAGALALLCYWAAALARKGSPWHRAAGQGFLLAMLVVVGTGAPLAWSLWQGGHPRTATFLAYLLLLVSSAMWSARQAVRLKHDFVRYAGPAYRAQAMAVALAGGLVVWIGMTGAGVIFVVFGLVGVVGGIGSLRLAWRGPSDARWWLREHYGAMIGNGVATHIAFLGIGLRGALPGIDPMVQQLLAWLLPVAVAVMAAVWLDRRYGRPSSASSPPLPGRRNSTT